MAFLNEVFTIMLTYLGVVVLMFLALNIFTSGWLSKFLRVKMSRGKKILVQVNTVTQDYHRLGIIQEGFLVFKDRNKEERRIKISRDSIYRSKGVDNVDVDDEKNVVMQRDYKSVEGFDASKFNNLYIRALYKPSLRDNKEQIMFFIMIGVALLVLAAAYFGYKNNALLMQIIANMPKAVI